MLGPIFKWWDVLISHVCMLFFLGHNISGKRFYVQNQKDEYNYKRLKR